jgi:hypothetical protein
VDEEFKYLAGVVPGGFGGMYYDDQNRPTVFLKDVRKQHGANGVLKAYFRNRLRQFPNGRSEAAEFRFVQGQHDFATLADWRRGVDQDVFSIPGVVSTDIDEVRNRLEIGIDDAAANGRVHALLARLGVPPGAVVIEPKRREQPMLRLDDRAPAVAGGYFIQWLYGQCTLGFNAYYGSQRVFVTASHCSRTQFAPDADNWYHQWRTATTDDRIGYEYNDPRPYYDPACSETYMCRWADALLGLWTVTRWDYGRIARPSGGANSGSLVVDPYQPTFNIIGEIQYGFVGDEIHRIGMVTGWRSAKITDSCESFLIGNTITPCMELAPFGAQQGDSGGPVFSMSPYAGWVYLRGVVSKSQAFSNMFDIQDDLGELQTALCTTANPYYPSC